MRLQTMFLALGLLVAAGLALWLPVPLALRLPAAGLLAFFLPGWFLVVWLGLAGDRLEGLVLAVGTSYTITVLGALGLLDILGFLSAPWLLAFLMIVTLLFAAGVQRSSPAGNAVIGLDRPFNRRDAFYFAFPVAVAAFFSLTNLGYSDYLGDEMNGLLRALAVIRGRPETLLEHTKGPVEVLLPAAFGLLAGHFDPFTLRLPFALAHVAGTGAFYLLGRRLLGREAGLLAALLLVVNGLYLAFGRMIQYQAVVFLMMSLAALLAGRFYRSGRAGELGLAAALTGAGLLAHYDMLLVFPAIAYLVWRRYGWHRRAWRQAVPVLLASGLVLALVSLIFYLPFLLHPHLGKTSSYLARVIGASDWPGNNFDELYLFTVMYNSRYYALVVALLGTGAIGVELVRLFQAQRRSRWLWAIVVLALGLSLVVVSLGRANLLPLLLSSTLLALLIGCSSLRPEVKMIYIWLGAAFIGYVFFVDRPRTHLQIIFPAWSLLAALALVSLVAALARRWPALRQSWAVAGAAAGLALLLVLFGAYEYLLFVDAGREYIFTYPQHRQALYWEDAGFPFGSRRLYGAPHRLGWQMIQSLYEQGLLGDDWGSNDQGTNLFWYTLGAPRNPCYPRYYFRTHFEQKEDGAEVDIELPLDDYVQIGQVWNRDRLQIDIFEFAPLAKETEVRQWFEPEIYAPVFQPEDFRSLPYEEVWPNISIPLPAPAVFKPGRPALEQIAGQYGDSRIVDVRDKVTLLGYDLDDRRARPGGLVVLTLNWQAAEVINLPYKVFAHLEAMPPAQVSFDAQVGSRLWTQSDDFPACGARPTERWQVGQPVLDRHILHLPADIPPGKYRLRIGLYEPQTGLRMDLLDGMGNPQGDSLELSEVTVRPGD